MPQGKINNNLRTECIKFSSCKWL